MKRFLERLQVRYCIYGMLVGLIVFAVFGSLLNGYISNEKQQEEIYIARQFSTFASKVTSTVMNNKLLLDGYLAYLETTELAEEDTLLFLQHLLESKDELIRSVTIIEDTTIKWIYPKDSNTAAIGVDLAKVEGQKDIILKIKKEHIEVIQGPVDLVQGGQGIIIRLPVIKEENRYFGQLSIVLDLDKLSSRIQSIAEKEGLRVHLISNQNSKVISDDFEILKHSPMIFEIKDASVDWTVYVIPKGDWENNLALKLLLFLGCLVVSILGGIIVYIGFVTNNQLHHLANKDHLTGLYNRRFLDEYQSIIMVRAERYNKKIGFMLLDLDDFKKINDIYGHKIGDEVLIQTARILKEQTRLNESIFRLGGDEFLVLLPDLENTDKLEILMNRILMEFKKTMVIKEHMIIIKPSIGLAIYPDEGTNFEQMLHKADQKMYEQKKRL